MDFDRLLDHFEGSGQKEIVALVVFYLEEYQEIENATITALTL